MNTSMRGAGTRSNKAWVGVPTFMRSNYCPDPTRIDADVAVYGVPFDEGSPFANGSRFAPRSLREHSMRFGGTHGFFDIDADRNYLAHEVGNARIGPYLPVDQNNDPVADGLNFGKNVGG